MRQLTIVIKGAGEMATGIAHRLFVSGFTRIVMSEIARPIAVRRLVAFCEAVYDNGVSVEDVRAELIKDVSELPALWERKVIGVIVDEKASFIDAVKPDIIIDAIMAKRPRGSMRKPGAFTIGVGPGFVAPDDADAVVESNRGHDLGRVIYRGQAEPYTGVPGTTAGFTKERVLRSPHAGMVRPVKTIGDTVRKGETVAYVDETAVPAQIDGIVRGLIRPIPVTDNEKLGDVEPRGEKRYCYTISEKAHAIGGGVLEAVMHRFFYSEAG